jgi:hypothetical protein
MYSKAKSNASCKTGEETGGSSLIAMLEKEIGDHQMRKRGRNRRRKAIDIVSCHTFLLIKVRVSAKEE